MRLFQVLTAAIVLIASAGALAQQPAEQGAQEQTFVEAKAADGSTVFVGKKSIPQGGVMGHVLCTDTHTPARGARIMLLSAASVREDGPLGGMEGQPLMAVTGLDGGFVVPHVAPGEYMVIALAAGYLSPMDGMQMPEDTKKSDNKAMVEALRHNAPVVRINGQEVARIDIELVRGAVLSGKVVYSDGSPAGQLPMKLLKATSPHPGEKTEETRDVGDLIRTMFLQQTHMTDDQGHFRIAGIAPGSYWLGVTQTFEVSSGPFEDLMSFPDAKPKGKLTIYSGDTLHRKDAKVYKLLAGDVADGIEIVLPLNGLHAIRGIAAGKDGSPLNAGSLDLVDTGDPAINFHARIEADGSFHFSGIPEDSYQLKASNAFIFENPPPADFQEFQEEEQMRFMRNQGKPLRAFTETTIPVIVQNSDIEGLALTLTDTKLPDIQKQANPQEADQAIGPSAP